MKRVLLIMLLAFLMSACDQLGQDRDYSLYEQEEGIISVIEADTETFGYQGWYALLVIPNIEDMEISSMTEEELVSLAQENDGAYYGVSPDIYDELELEIGIKVKVYFDGQGDSDPPVRIAEKIEIILNE